MRVAVHGVLFALLLLTECAAAQVPAAELDLFEHFRTPDCSAPFLDFEKSWPDRYGQREIDGEFTRGIVIEMPGPLEVESGALRAGHRSRSQADADAIAHGLGIGREVSAVAEGIGAYIVTGEPVKRARLRTNVEGRRHLRFLSAQEWKSPVALPAQEGDDALPVRVLVQSTWFTFDPPRADAPELGVALIMPGMFGTPDSTLQMLSRRLRDRGWWVLRMVAQPSRFTERLSVTLDPAEASRVSRAAQELNDRTAECAYAVAHVLREIEAGEPRFKSLPRVAIGLSAGAMSLPTVVAYEPQRYRAAVMIAGGCHYWLMALTSNYRDWIDAVRVRWTREPTTDELRAIEDSYLKHATLDSFHTARALRDVEVLLIQGTHDLAVPSPLGDCLWERLGKPRRELFPVGHELIALQLPTQFGSILDFCEASLRNNGAVGEPGGAKTP